mmetsp:Transcript_11477/g.29860  ORF Transcript_11477/g.29860 Transcript_11477/m.29860 type:complete len:235 (+) Transcript_11477:1268-1972(+)
MAECDQYPPSCVLSTRRITAMKLSMKSWIARGTMPETMTRNVCRGGTGTCAANVSAATMPACSSATNTDHHTVMAVLMAMLISREFSRSRAGRRFSSSFQSMSRASGAGQSTHARPGVAPSAPLTSSGEVIATTACISEPKVITAARARGGMTLPSRASPGPLPSGSYCGAVATALLSAARASCAATRASAAFSALVLPPLMKPGFAFLPVLASLRASARAAASAAASFLSAAA